MKENYTAIGIVVVCLLIGAYFLGASSNKPRDYPQQNSTVNSVPSHTQEYQNSFINSCGYGQIYCTCLYNQLSQHYSDQTISSLDYRRGYISDPQLINAFQTCNNRFQN